ncbi:hypothetical protein, partial [Klebsiella quasipneumoniae]|uniref:hypothetical protein n=1 Tax=Klebsiella quasipneumoniae TaxID=1463165 RepID=UPI001940242A
KERFQQKVKKITQFVKLMHQRITVTLRQKFNSIFKMNIKSIITAAIALLVSTACSGGAKQEKVMNKDGKAIVVFFSHAGDNYAVGNIEVGN